MVQFIAEVSSNHARDINRCLQFIACSAEIGCTAVKFQLFRMEQLFRDGSLTVEEFARRKNWELPLEFLPFLSKRCREMKIQFACTPFYLEAVDELDPFLDIFKIASYELLWDDLLAACAGKRKPIMLSTGMASLAEIQHAVDVLKSNGCADPLLFHCTSSYPTPFTEANLAAIETLRKSTGCEVGWSDHTVEPAVIHRAVHRWGAKMIEFHLDLDGQGEEYATGHCWLPDQIGKVIQDVNKGFQADGNGIKEPGPSELADRDWRADPSDGLRPMKKIRSAWMPSSP